MTAVQLNAMNRELWQGIGSLADDESMMARLTRYVKRLIKEKEDTALVSKADFFRSLDEGEEQYRQGRTHTISTPQQLQDFLNSL